MRILHINNIANVASVLVREQREKGHDSDLVILPTPAYNSGLLKKLLTSPIRLWAALRIRRLIRARKIDILHVHYMSSAIWFIGTKAKLVVHAHGTDVRIDDPKNLNSLINQIVCRFCDILLYSTPDLQPYVRRLKQNCHFLPNPVDIDTFQPKPAESGQGILLHSTLSRIKGADISVPALKSIKKRFPCVKISVICSGELERSVEGCGFQVIPPVEHDMVNDLINQHDIVVGQFKLGALGVSELEAMACEKPVLCSWRFPDAYPTEPKILNATSSAAIEEILEIYCRNPNTYEDLGRKAREWVCEYHNSNSINERVEQLYKLIVQ